MAPRDKFHVVEDQEPDPYRNLVFPDDDCIWLDIFDLRKRGWTEALVNKFLGKPERWIPVNHFRNFTGKRAYFLPRVEKAERSSQFNKDFGASLKRRKLDAKTIGEIMANRRKGTIEACLYFRVASRNGIDMRHLSLFFPRAPQALQELANDVLRPHVVSEHQVDCDRELSD